ncbi:MAG: hypothetical protein JWM12_161 [Ilumatobacteraceae bacterium]|nr:hypothetical protein [Ilumatobacteraceae bacterium]
MVDTLRAWVGRRRAHLAVALICLAIFQLCRSMQEQGHGWGDDFALYIDQARGLTDGSVGDVASLTRYALDNSSYSTFSAYVYPWVFPMLLAPIVALKGIDYSALKLVGTLSFVVGLFFLQRIVRHRAGTAASIVIMLAVGLNNLYIGYTDAVLSDLTFFMLLMIGIWWLDHVTDRGRLFGDSLWPLIGLGALACLAFDTRKEGVALLLGIFAAQAVRWREARALAARVSDGWKRVAITFAAPYLAFGAGALIFQTILPGQPYDNFQRAGGSGLHNMKFNLKWYRLPFAEAIGLKDIGAHPLSMLGSTSLANAVFWVFVVTALLGIAWRTLLRPRLDAHLTAVLFGLVIVILSPPFREGRYLLSVLPFMLYFAWQGVDGVQRFLVGHARQWPSVLATAALAIPLVCVATDTWGSYKYHRDYSYVEWGPDNPSVQEAFAAVTQYTDARDVVVFFQARTMNLYTRRRAIQGNSESMMLQRGDWFLMARDSDYIQTNLTDARATLLGFVKMWQNAKFVLWRIPPRYPPLPAGPGVPP